MGAARQPLKQGNGPGDTLIRARPIAHGSIFRREQAQYARLRLHVAYFAPAGSRSGSGGNGVPRLIRERAFLRMPLEEFCPKHLCQRGAVAQGSTQMYGRFPMGTKPGGFLGSKGGQFENGRGVLSKCSMMNQSRRIGVSFYERPQHSAVQRAGTFRLNRAIDGKTRKLMAESDRVGLRVEQAPGAGFVERALPRAKNGFDEPALGPSG
jgi:hypothetical protein